MRLLLLITLVSVFFFSCSPTNNKGPGKVIAHNLLEENKEVPVECKPPLSTDENKIAFIHFRGRVNRCVKQMEQSPDLITFFGIDDCLKAIGSSFKEVTDENCRAVVQVEGAEGNVMSVMFILLDDFYLKFINDPDGDEPMVWDQMSNYLALLGTWFDQSRGNIYPLDDGKLISDRQFNDFNDNISVPLWNSITKNDEDWKATFGEIVLPVSQIDDEGQVLSDEEVLAAQIAKNRDFETFKTMLTVNKRFLDYAFASDLANDLSQWRDGDTELNASPVLAILLGEALNPIFERMNIIAKIYDIACKLDGCSNDFYKNSSLFWIINYFSSLSKGEEMPSLNYGDASDELVEFIELLNTNRSSIASIISAFNRSFEVSNIATATIGTDFPNYFEGLQKVFANSYDYLASYQNTQVGDRAGYFVSGSLAEINVGFSEANINRHVENVRTSNEKLEQLRERFNSNKHTLISEILALNSSKTSLESLESTINSDITDMLNEKNQIDAIMKYIQMSRKDYTKKVLALIDDPVLDDSAEQFSEQNQNIYTIYAAHSTQGDGTITSVSLANIDSSQSFGSGDLLQISVNNQWSPTCAVSANYGTDVIGALTGPGGFYLTESDGESEVESTNDYSTKESYSDVGVSLSVCVGTNGLSDLFSPVSVKACANTSFGTRTSSGTTSSATSSSSSRTDASFSLGIALPDTPFPTAPAGSLLLVEMPRGETDPGLARSVQVLDASYSYSVKSDNSDFYLVANDCNSSYNSGSLVVTVRHLVPQGDLAADYISKVSEVMTEIEERASTLIEAGILSYDVKESLKKELKGSIGIDLDQFSGQMKYLVESFIDNEIAILDYKSQVVTLERSIESKKQLILSLLDQYSSGEQEVYLRTQTRNWLLSNLDLNYLNSTDTNQDLYTINKVLSILENSLVSYLDFKYRNDEKELILGNISLLQEIDLSDNFDTISENIYAFVNTLLDNIVEDINNKPLVPKMSVGIKIPNPYYVSTFDLPDPDFYLYPVMNETKAKAFWDNLINWQSDSRELILDMEISDLYTDEGLGCFVESPIIETMGMFFIPENEAYITDFNNNYRYQNAKVYLEGTSSIPFVETERVYNFVNTHWRYMDVANRMAKSDNDAIRMLTSEFPPESTDESGLATGRPPFGKFKIGHLRPYRMLAGQVLIGETPINEIKEVFIGYVMSANNSNFDINLDWIPYCSGN